MRPIGQIGSLKERSVLYHSAFGFAAVVAVEAERVTLAWDAPGDNLPNRVPHEVVLRIYATTADGGFFWRSLHEPASLVTALNETPVDALALLLADLNGPQRPSDLRDWLVGRRLLTSAAFSHWWKSTRSAAVADPRFEFDGDTVSLRTPEQAEDPRTRLANPLLQPGRRLEIALDLRKELRPDEFLEHVLTAWRAGGTQVRELALAATRDLAPDPIFRGLLTAGNEGMEAVIHVLRRGAWTAEQVSVEVHGELVERILRGTQESGPLDTEGRLAASLCRWGSPAIERTLADVAGTTDGRRLLRATFAAMPARRGESLALQLLRHVLAQEDAVTAQWIGNEALGFALVDASAMADRIDPDWPELADWYRHEFRAPDGPMQSISEDSIDDTAHTAEIDLSGLADTPISLSELPARSGASLLGLGLAMARALAHHHKDGRVVNPTARTCRLNPDETMVVEPLPDGPECPRAEGEPASLVGDLYASAVLLVEAILGRPWPRDVLACRALPYLRGIVQNLSPAVLAPMDLALHPDPTQRPHDGLVWLSAWQHAAMAEEKRGYAVPDPSARLTFGYDTHVGRMKVLSTQTNQDAIFVSNRGGLCLALVCDGISTANAGSGDVASSIASHVIANMWEQAAPRLAQGKAADVRDFLDKALRTANTAVCDAAYRFAGGNLDGRVPMGTTALVALCQGNLVHLAWLGDSRAYLVGPYGASLLTSDENQAGERLRAWHLSYIDHWEPVGFALVGYLGHFNELLRAEALPAHHTSFMMNPGERLVLCSDGVTDYVGESHPEVAQVLSSVARVDDLDEAARQLVALANRAGGGDNASAVLVSLW